MGRRLLFFGPVWSQRAPHVAENIRSFHMSPTDDRSAKQVVHTGSELGPYSAAVVAGEHCYVAGIGGFKPGTRELVEGGIEAEIKTTLDNLAATLRQAGFRLDDVVSATCYLPATSRIGWCSIKIYRGYFGEDARHGPPLGSTTCRQGRTSRWLRGVAGRGAGGSYLRRTGSAKSA